MFLAKQNKEIDKICADIFNLQRTISQTTAMLQVQHILHSFTHSSSSIFTVDREQTG
jgi:hypothetical protein